MFNVKIFNSTTSFSCNVYVCSSSKGNFVVDPGYVDDRLLKYIASIGGIDFILITHGHFDHIYGLNKLTSLYPNASVYAYKDELEVIYDPRKNCSLAFDGNRLEIEKDIIPLDESTININNYSIKVIHTPGHTKGGAVYIFDEEKAVFFGDTVICESIGRYDLPTSNEAKLFNSLTKIKELKLSLDYIAYFGHGTPYKVEKLLKINSYLR